MKILDKDDQWSGIFLLLLSLYIIRGSLRFTYGTIHNPGPGFMPLWLGLILGAMSIGLILRASGARSGSRQIREILEEKIRWGKVLSVLLALIFYGLLLGSLGFFVSTFLFLAFLLWFIDPQPLKAVIGWGLAGSLGAYLIFEVWLKLRLPKGFLGI